MRVRYWLTLAAVIVLAGLVVTTCEDDVEREVDDRIDASVGPQPADPSAGLAWELAAASSTTSTAAPARNPHRVVSRSARARSAAAGRAEGCTLEVIKQRESGGRYDAQNPRSSASGAYQVLDSTWNGHGGYRRASDAPPEVQDEFARQLYARAGSRPWVVCR